MKSQEIQQSTIAEAHVHVDLLLEGNHGTSQDQGCLAHEAAAGTQIPPEHKGPHRHRKTVYGERGEKEFTTRVAHTIEEDEEFIEAGFEYFKERDRAKVYRKRK